MFTFDKPGKENTEKTIELALERAKELGLIDFVIASNTGITIEKFIDIAGDIKDLNVVCITHHVGFKEPGFDEMTGDTRDKLKSMGVKILTTTHLFGNIERAITNKFGGLYPGGIISGVLRCFCQGVKVCFEISSTALDGGLIPYGNDVMFMAGTGRGCDTAMIIKAAHGKDFFDTSVKEIVCMPR